ncbi:MAG: hypothetical protein WDZ35_00390 [Crocinitomicaceae bacterium]
MKKVFYALPVAALMLWTSCGEGESEENVFDEAATDLADFDKTAKSFSEGGAKTGREYFLGVQAEVIEVDVKLREVNKLDQNNVAEEKIISVLDTALALIKDAKKAMEVYEAGTWPKQDELHQLTIDWFDVVADLIENHLYELAEPMSRPDDTWTDEEIARYDVYSEAYNSFYEIDNEWIDFQTVYADANNFKLKGTIDEDAMVDEEVANMEE